MNNVIVFFFQLLAIIWETITSHWLLSIGFMITVLSYIIVIVNSSKSEN